MADDSQYRYYHHSGQFSPGGTLMALLLGLLIGAPMAFVYAWLIHWDPIIYINLLACAAFAWLIGYATEQVLVSRKCRSVPVAAAVALLVALGSYYMSWAVWLHFMMTEGSILEFMKPLNMLGAILAVNDHGAWTYNGSLIKGGELWVAWAAEAGAFLGIACYAATHEMLEATFCEGCEVWTKQQEGVCRVAAGSAPSYTDLKAVASYLKGLKQHAAELKMRLESKDLSYLEQLGPVEPDAIAWYQFDLHTCPRCNMTHTLRVIQRKRKVEGKQVRKQMDDKEVLRQLLVSSTEAEAMRKLGQPGASA
jgi:hypothetical protein